MTNQINLYMEGLKNISSSTNDPWENSKSKFKNIKIKSSRKKGADGEHLAKEWLISNGFTCTKPKTSDYDLVVDGKKVEIKTSFLGEGNRFIFEQIRPHQGYDYIICIGICPNDSIYAWVISHSDSTKLIKENKIRPQHGGKFGNNNTWMFNFSIDKIPSWLNDFGGIMSEETINVIKSM